MKEIVILGGPNGAGKTTAAKKLLAKFPSVQEFLNADEFARVISPRNPESVAFAAGRKLLERMQELIAAGASCLSVEAGRTLLFDREALLRRAAEAGIVVVATPRQGVGTTQVAGSR